MDHPVVIPESVRIYDRTPFDQPLKAWEERYPDGSVRSFYERWHTFTVPSGTTYCTTVVVPTTPDQET